MAVFAELGSLAEFVNGAAFKPTDWGDEGKPIVRIQNLTGSSEGYNRTTRRVNPKLYVDPGDLLVSWSATLGVYEWAGPEVAVLNQHIFRVLPDERLVDKRFLRHGLDRALLEMRRHLHGATMQHVNRGEFLSTKLHLPSLPEQRQIAEVLDYAAGLRTKRRAALAQLDTLTQAIFLDMFGDPATNPKGWPRVPFSQLLETIESGWSPVCLDRPASGDEWGVLKLGAVTWCEYDARENKALPPAIEPIPELEVRPGDLLFSRKNTYNLVAACVLVRTTPPRLLMPDLIFRFRLRPDAAIDPTFLHQLLIYPTKRREMQKLAGGSAGSMPNISKRRLELAPIEMPPLERQRKFAGRVEGVEQIKAGFRNSLTELNAMFASLQHRAFSGEL